MAQKKFWLLQIDAWRQARRRQWANNLINLDGQTQEGYVAKATTVPETTLRLLPLRVEIPQFADKEQVLTLLRKALAWLEEDWSVLMKEKEDTRKSI